MLEAYSPLGHGRHLSSDIVATIGERHGRTPAQVLPRWGIEQQVPLLATSRNRDHIAANLRIFDFTLTDLDHKELADLDRTGGSDQAQERKWW